MAKQYTSKQIAAHFSQGYIDEQKDPEVLQDFIRTLEARVPTLRRSGDRQCYQDVSSLLYCVKDLKGSCRDAGMSADLGKKAESDQSLNRAANRVQEIGQIMMDIHTHSPEEYEKSCRSFIMKWKDIEFDQGEKLLAGSTAEPVKAAQEQFGMKLPEKKDAAPAGPSL